MNRKIKLLVVIVVLILAVFFKVRYIRNHPGKEKMMSLINSSGACDRIEGFIALGKSKDTSLYYLFFINLSDRNIAHCFSYYGKSVLWAKIEALRKITNVEPELRYDVMRPDIRILEQYKRIIYKAHH